MPYNVIYRIDRPDIKDKVNFLLCQIFRELQIGPNMEMLYDLIVNVQDYYAVFVVSYLLRYQITDDMYWIQITMISSIV